MHTNESTISQAHTNSDHTGPNSIRSHAWSHSIAHSDAFAGSDTSTIVDAVTAPFDDSHSITNAATVAVADFAGADGTTQSSAQCLAIRTPITDTHKISN
jgi:hypothetical protein